MTRRGRWQGSSHGASSPIQVHSGGFRGGWGGGVRAPRRRTRPDAPQKAGTKTNQTLHHFKGRRTRRGSDDPSAVEFIIAIADWLLQYKLFLQKKKCNMLMHANSTPREFDSQPQELYRPVSVARKHQAKAIREEVQTL